MNSIYKLLVILFICNTIYSQNSINTNLNLDFELIKNNEPKDWTIFPSKNKKFVKSENLIVQSGKNSISIEHKNGTFKSTSLLNNIPTIYNGEVLEIEVFIKTKDVKKVKIWSRIDHNVTYTSKHFSGTNDWKKTKLKLNLTKLLKADQITFGITLNGKGKVWIDNFKLTIDGLEINNWEKEVSELLKNKNDLIKKIKVNQIDLSNEAKLNKSLNSIIESLGDKKIVAIGEDTHGTSEFYKLREQITKKLILEKGFNTIVLENPYDDIELLKNNLSHKSIDTLIQNHLFSIYQTKEMKSFIQWLKENKTVQFKGCDDSYWVFDKLLKKEITQLKDIELDSLCNAFIEKSTYSLEEYNSIHPSNKLNDDIDLYSKAYQDILMIEKNLNDKNLYSKRLKELIHNAKTSYVNYENIRNRKSIKSRDEMMADRISFLAKSPSAKIIVWAHNAHISNTVIIDNEIGIMGKKLKENFGKNYHSIGLSSLNGEYSYIESKFINNDHNYNDNLIKSKFYFTPPISWESFLSTLNKNDFYFNTKDINTNPILENLKLIGYMKESANDYYKLNILTMFDTIFFVHKTNATKPIFD